MVERRPENPLLSKECLEQENTNIELPLDAVVVQKRNKQFSATVSPLKTAAKSMVKPICLAGPDLAADDNLRNPLLSKECLEQEVTDIELPADSVTVPKHKDRSASITPLIIRPNSIVTPIVPSSSEDTKDHRSAEDSLRNPLLSKECLEQEVTDVELPVEAVAVQNHKQLSASMSPLNVRPNSIVTPIVPSSFEDTKDHRSSEDSTQNPLLSKECLEQAHTEIELPADVAVVPKPEPHCPTITPLDVRPTSIVKPGSCSSSELAECDMPPRDAVRYPNPELRNPLLSKECLEQKQTDIELPINSAVPQKSSKESTSS